MGHDQLKMAACLSLFSGNAKMTKGGSRIRGDIHVLFLGDPGTGKSQILQNCAIISPRSVYTSGRGASAAGLTAAVVRENDITGMQLEAGALVLASGGVACIDEFDKMKQEDRVAIHEAMEQQTVSIAKAGIIATLQAQTAIIAAANPKMGRYDDYATPSENINLPPPILSRFDLIFVVRDTPERNSDDKIADHILHSHMEGYDETYIEEVDDATNQNKKSEWIPLELLKKYIRHARNVCHPRLTREAAQKIKEFYINLRNSTQPGADKPAITIVARNLDGIVRMCEAYAKMAFRDYVSLDDVNTIIELVKKSLHDIGYDAETGTIDMDRMLTGTSSNKRQKFRKILDSIKALQKDNPSQNLKFEDIFEPNAAIEGVTEEFLKEALEMWLKDGTLYQPKPKEYRLIGNSKKWKKSGDNPNSESQDKGENNATEPPPRKN
jgi:replicative DNA helicase Mcm